MKTLSVSSTPIPPVASSRPMSTVSYLSEYEILDTSTQSIKKPVTNVASFPPRQNTSLFNSIPSTNGKSSLTTTNPSKTDTINEQYSSSMKEIIHNDRSRFPSNNKNDQARDLSTPTPANHGGVRFGNNISGGQTVSSM